MLNPDTLTVVCGYAGDADQIRSLLPYYLHHHTQVLVLSPDDAPISRAQGIGGREVVFATGGKRAYVGPVSLERQLEHLKILQKRPEKFFLVHDSDSVCLSPKLPAYLYAEPDVLWSNVVSDEFHPRAADYKFPRLAFQPPYFFSRSVLDKLIVAAPTVEPNPRSPFIDWCMMAWAVTAGIPYKTFPDGMSCGTGADNPLGVKCMTEGVGIHGKIFLHSVKRREMIRALAHQRIEFKRRHPG